MCGSEICSVSFWWMFPVLMIFLCFFMMRGRRGSMMCGFGPWGTDNRMKNDPKSVMEILDKRFAHCEIDKEEYQEKKRVLSDFSESEKDQI